MLQPVFQAPPPSIENYIKAFVPPIPLISLVSCGFPALKSLFNINSAKLIPITKLSVGQFIGGVSKVKFPLNPFQDGGVYD